eukprot:362127-Chlamydomonas_euryale.AAC.1
MLPRSPPRHATAAADHRIVRAGCRGAGARAAPWARALCLSDAAVLRGAAARQPHGAGRVLRVTPEERDRGQGLVHGADRFAAASFSMVLLSTDLTVQMVSGVGGLSLAAGPLSRAWLARQPVVSMLTGTAATGWMHGGNGQDAGTSAKSHFHMLGWLPCDADWDGLDAWWRWAGRGVVVDKKLWGKWV